MNVCWLILLLICVVHSSKDTSRFVACSLLNYLNYLVFFLCKYSSGIYCHSLIKHWLFVKLFCLKLMDYQPPPFMYTFFCVLTNFYLSQLGETISPMKEDFIMVHLQHACTHCCILMVSGNRWVCKQCKNFQLCDKYDSCLSHFVY